MGTELLARSKVSVSFTTLYEKLLRRPMPPEKATAVFRTKQSAKDAKRPFHGRKI
jgi:hypothetical protein